MRKKLFELIGQLVTRWPWWVVGVAVAITLFSAILTLSSMRLDSDLDHLVSDELEYHKRYLNFIQDFGDQEYLYLVVETNGKLKEAKRFVDAFAEKLSGKPEIKSVTTKIDNPDLEKSFLLFIPKEELEQLGEMVGGSDASLATVARAGNAEGFFELIEKELENPNPEDEERLKPLFEFFDQILDGLQGTLEGGETSVDLARLFFGSSRYDEEGYLVSGNGKFLFALIMPTKNFETMEVIEKPLQVMRSALDDTRKEFPDVTAGLTGKPALASDEITITNNDMIRATIFALIAVALIFMLALRSVSSPLLAVASLLVGISWTYGFATIVFGKLNILSVVFAIILVGAAIEYGVHMVTFCRQERANGKSADEAVVNSINAVGSANMISAFTTAAAFLALTITKFTALAQLGLIAATGIILCLIAADLVLPAMLVLRERMRKKGAKIVPPIRLTFLMKVYRHWKWVTVAALVFFILAIYGGTKVGFNHNLLELQAEGLESVEYEHKLINETDESSWFAVSFTFSIEKSQKLAKKFAALKSVKRTEDITSIFPVDQYGKRRLITEKIAPAVEKVVFVDKKASDPGILRAKIAGIRNKLESFMEDAFSSGRVDAVSEIEKLTEKLQKVEDLLLPDSKPALNKWESALFGKLKEGVDLLKGGLEPPRVSLEDMPSLAKERFIGKSGRYAVYIYPEHDIWDPVKLEEFVNEIQAIDPEVTGTPVEVLEGDRLMEGTFRRAAIIAAIIVFLIALLYFHSWRGGALAMIPLLLGMGWLVGAMYLFNIRFNLANFFAIPIILGIGIDSAIHIINRIRTDGSLESVTKATGTGVLLTVATNVVGFGMLLTAHHRGIRSLGEIMAIGAFLCFVAAIIVLPPLVQWMRRIKN